MAIVRRNISELTDQEKNKMFEMYVKSYTMGRQELWFKTPEELFGEHSRYKCFITFDDEYLTVYAMYQFKSKYNKISLVCHNGSDEGKQKSIELRHALITQPGWILEAADKVSWILRKRGSPVITEYDKIVDALDIDVNKPNDRIVMNPNFDYSSKITHSYTRIFIDKNGKEYHSNETLFGVEPCDYRYSSDDDICGRMCTKKAGAARRSIKSRSRKYSRSKRRNTRHRRTK
jgi:hypothetical protein